MSNIILPNGFRSISKQEHRQNIENDRKKNEEFKERMIGVAEKLLKILQDDNIKVGEFGFINQIINNKFNNYLGELKISEIIKKDKE